MADVEQNVAVPDAAGNGSDAVNGTAGRFVSSPEGTALAYGSLLFMALLPIFFGALRSVGCSKSKVNLLTRGLCKLQSLWKNVRRQYRRQPPECLNLRVTAAFTRARAMIGHPCVRKQSPEKSDLCS